MDLTAQTKNTVDITVNTQLVLKRESQDLARDSPYYQQWDGHNDDFWAETHPAVLLPFPDTYFNDLKDARNNADKENMFMLPDFIFVSWSNIFYKF